MSKEEYFKNDIEFANEMYEAGFLFDIEDEKNDIEYDSLEMYF